MPSTIEHTRRHLGEALDKELALYERYVSSPDVLAEYVRLTKEALLLVVEDVFNRKIAELSSRKQAADVANPLGAVAIEGAVGEERAFATVKTRLPVGGGP